jgi:multidrug efflux pump subunit AcrB
MPRNRNAEATVRVILLFLLAVYALSTTACGARVAAPDGVESEKPLVKLAEAFGGKKSNNSVIRVTAYYPGASAHVVADTIAAPIEQQVNGVEGMIGMESECRNDGSYSLTVRFGSDVDIEVAQVLVQNRVNLTLQRLPALVTREGVSIRRVPDAPPAFWLAVTSSTGEHPLPGLASIARTLVTAELTRLPGVTDVSVVGPCDAGMDLVFDWEKQSALDVKGEDVIKVIELQGARVESRQLRCLVTVLDRQTNPTKFEKLVVKKTADGKEIRVEDVAKLVPAPDGGFAEKDGQPAVLVAVTVQPGKVTEEEILKAVGGIANMPGGIRVEVFADVDAGRAAVVDMRLPSEVTPKQRRETVARAAKFIRGMPGSPGCTAFSEDREANTATLIVTHPEGNIPTVQDIRLALRELPGAICRVSIASARHAPFPVRIAVCQAAWSDYQDLRRVAEEAAQKLSTDGGVTDVAVWPAPAVARLGIEIDLLKLRELEVSVDDAVSAIRAAEQVQSAWKRDNTYHLWLDYGPRARATTLAALKLRTVRGDMVTLGECANIHVIEWESAVLRVNLHTAMLLRANPADGMSPADAAEQCMELLKLPKGYQLENLTHTRR